MLIAELAMSAVNLYHLVQYHKTDPKITPREISGKMTFDGELYVLTSPENTSYATVLVYDFGKIKRGTYDVSVHYEAESTQRIAVSAIPKESYQSNEIILDYRLNSVDFTLSPTKSLNNMKIYVMHKGTGDFSIDLELSRSRTVYIRNLVSILFCFSAAEIALVLFARNPWAAKILCVLILISILAFLPYMLTGIIPGHDFDYHFMRIEALANELRYGQFPVYMESLWIGNYGYPASLYYCDFFLYIPALLRLAGNSFNAAYKIFVFLVNLLSAFLAFLSFRKVFGKKKLSLILTCAYVCSPYRLVDIYIRNAVGEYCAISFLPLVFAGLYGIITAEPKHQDFRSVLRSYIPFLSFGMAGIILSHVLTVEIVAVILVMVCLFSIRKLLNIHKILALFRAVLQCILLSMAFTVPFLDFYFHNSLDINQSMQSVIPVIQGNGIQPGEFFLFFKPIFGLGHGIRGWENRMYLSAGVVLTFALILSIVYILFVRRNKRLMAFTLLAVLSCWLASSLFPYDFLAQKSRLGVYLAQIQFPWRFMELVSLFSVAALGELLLIFYDDFRGLAEKNRFSVNAAAENSAVVLMFFLVAAETALFASQYEPGRNRTIINNTAELEMGLAKPCHILRAGTDVDRFSYQIETNNVTVTKSGNRGTNWNLTCETGEVPGTVTMPLQNYKGYQVKDEYGNSYEIFDGGNNEVCFSLPANFNGNIAVSFQPPFYWPCAAVISFLSACAFMISTLKKNIVIIL